MTNPADALQKIRDEITRTHRVWDEVDSSCDRAAAVLATADLDDELRCLLEAKIGVASGDSSEAIFARALQSMGTKIIFAEALGLIGSATAKDLRVIGEIRNKFAHRVDLGDPAKKIEFTSPVIDALCRKLKIVDAVISGRKWSTKPTDARGLFLRSIDELIFLVRLSRWAIKPQEPLDLPHLI
ncbi:MAG: hypothetical protein K8U03_05695 [Planctomycetia bacterium]|nr:hypothetical protein [Planctomycetia bacterium]